MTPNGNPAAKVEMSNLAMRYLTYSNAVDRRNGKMYTITMGSLILLPERASYPISLSYSYNGIPLSYAEMCESSVGVSGVIDTPTAAESTHVLVSQFKER